MSAETERVRDHLQALVASAPPIPTPAQLASVLAVAGSGAPPGQVAAQVPGWSEADAADALDAFAVFWSRAGKFGKLTVRRGDATADLGGGRWTVAADPAWDRWCPATSVLTGLGAAALHPAPPEALDRFRARHYKPGPIPVTADMLWLLAWLGHTGLWDRVLSDLSAQDHRLAERVLVAWDFWEDRIEQARAAVARLLAASAEPGQAAAVAADAELARWLAPAEADRIADPARVLASDPGDARAAAILAARLAAVGRWRTPGVPDGLTAAHAQMACDAAGLSGDTRTVRAEVRSFLEGLGRTADLEVDVPAGVAAEMSGSGAAWRAAHRARAAGNPDWEQVWGGQVPSSA